VALDDAWMLKKNNDDKVYEVCLSGDLSLPWQIAGTSYRRRRCEPI
jgi:hypothetical protein